LPGRTIERFGSGPLFGSNTKNAIYQGVKFTEKNFATYAANAHRGAQRFCSRNGVARFAADLIAAAQ
jgi:hypothetical protein